MADCSRRRSRATSRANWAALKSVRANEDRLSMWPGAINANMPIESATGHNFGLG
jgi:hypothetical protein